MKEDIAAAYTSFSVKASEQTDVKLGLRYEYTTTNLGSVEQPVFADALRTSYRYKTWQLTVEYNFQNPSIYYLPIINAVTKPAPASAV